MSEQRRVTIRDVADAAGVSVATVSRVMSGSTSVNSEMADRVRQATSDLGYQPNGAAQGLASGMHHCVGVVLPDLSNPYFYDIIKATSVGATRDGYRMLVTEWESPGDELGTCLDVLPRVDGLLVLSSRMDLESLRHLASRTVPTVLVNRVELGVDLPMVGVDNFSAMLSLCQHLASLGHRRVVYLAGSPSAWQNRERWRAVEQARILGLDPVMVAADATIAAGFAATDEALSHDPTALIAFNDLAALGAIARLRELGIRTPEDMSVTGFDDIAMAQYADPALTTIVSPKEELGAQAWSMLVSRLSGKRPEQPPLLSAAVVHRASTGPAKA
ncbi:LacI family DNA-binding transcriptional regulator [Streptomyces sp. HNM0575]|uniref:substrate-binding domain-containing protein n=1 Tax=Streptomyces sp. HNM0575 TaxID=2716338 RepID=UPI0019D2BE2F